MELKDTIELMNSSDYKERFKAEYLQVKIRYDKLHKMLVKWDAGTLNFTPTCAKALLLEQKRYMGEYIRCLQVRAEVEGIELLKHRIPFPDSRLLKFLSSHSILFQRISAARQVLKDLCYRLSFRINRHSSEAHR